MTADEPIIDSPEERARRYVAMAELLERMHELARRPNTNGAAIRDMQVILDGHLRAFDDAEQEEMAAVPRLVVTSIGGRRVVADAIRAFETFVADHPV